MFRDFSTFLGTLILLSTSQEFDFYFLLRSQNSSGSGIPQAEWVGWWGNLGLLTQSEILAQNKMRQEVRQEVRASDGAKGQLDPKCSTRV